MNGQPNGDVLENCISLWFNYDGWHDDPCNDPITVYKCACSFKQRPLLKLRGLCKESNFDAGYTLYQGKSLAFYGLQQSKIEFDDVMGKWKMNVVALPTIGFTHTKAGQSMILGKHLWQISNDSSSCNEGNPYARYLKLTGCDDEEFTCSDGQCITMDQRCDQISDCFDESDEKDCKIVSRKENYNKKIPPFKKKKKTKVNVSMVFLSINDIREAIRIIFLKNQAHQSFS